MVPPYITGGYLRMLWRSPPLYRNSLPERGRNESSSTSHTPSGRGHRRQRPPRRAVRAVSREASRGRVMRQGPLAGSYPAVAAMVMFALIPYLALSAALGPLTPIISKQLHMSSQTMSLGSGLGNAAYAVGTVLAVQFAQHLPQRRMLVLYAVSLVIGSVLTAAAQDAEMFIAGHVLQGLCTSLLLIAAGPPMAIGFPANKLR